MAYMAISKVMGAPLNHQFYFRIFHEINHPAIGVPIWLRSPHGPLAPKSEPPKGLPPGPDQWINESMNQWINHWTNESVNQWTIESMHHWINESTNQQISEWTGERINRLMDGWMDGWIMSYFSSPSYIWAERPLRWGTSSLSYFISLSGLPLLWSASS